MDKGGHCCGIKGGISKDTFSILSMRGGNFFIMKNLHHFYNSDSKKYFCKLIIVYDEGLKTSEKMCTKSSLDLWLDFTYSR